MIEHVDSEQKKMIKEKSQLYLFLALYCTKQTNYCGTSNDENYINSIRKKIKVIFYINYFISKLKNRNKSNAQMKEKLIIYLSKKKKIDIQAYINTIFSHFVAKLKWPPILC